MFGKVLNKVRKNKFTVLITVFVIGLISITLGSAIINSVLTLSGTTKIKESRWLIHFDFVQNIEATNPNSDRSLDARITDYKKENISFSTTFKNVGDIYKFNVYTWNEGTIDAQIDKYTVNIPEQYKDYIDYDIFYDDEDITEDTTIQISENRTKNIYNSKYDYSVIEVKPCDYLYKDSMRKIVVEVTYKKEIPNQTQDINVDFNLKIDYVQEKTDCGCVGDKCNQHLLRIRPNGGKYNNKATETKIFLNEDDEVDINIPSRDSYNFDGWTVISPETGTYTFESHIDEKSHFKMGKENVIIEAKWKEGDYVARIMNTYYTTIQDAFDAVDSKNWDDNTVWLLKDTTEYPTNNATHKFKFNLAGHTVTGTITNSTNSSLQLVNGKIIAENNLSNERLQELGLESQPEAAVVNKGTIIVGTEGLPVDVENSIALIGNDYGLKNSGSFEFYDGYLEGTEGCNTDPSLVERGNNPEVTYGLLTEPLENNRKKVYLTTTPKRAVSLIYNYDKNGNTYPHYFYSLQDSFTSSSEYRKNSTTHNTDNDYIVYAIRDFEAAYPLSISENDRVIFDTRGFDVETGESVTNDGYFKIFNSKNNKSNIESSVTITNNANLVIDNVIITSTTDDNVITNNANLTLTNTTVNGNTGNGILNSSNGKINSDNNTVIKSNNAYGIYNTSNTLSLKDGKVYGIYNTGTIGITDDTEVYRVVNASTSDDVFAIYNTSSGTVNVSGGTISDNSNKSLVYNEGIINTTGGTISNTGNVIYNYSGTTNVKGGTITSSNVAISGTNVNVSNGEVISTSNVAISANTVSVSGGEITSEASTAINGTTVNVSGGTVTGETYGITSRYVTVTGGNVIGNDTGIVQTTYYHSNVKDGNINIDGGTITGKNAGVVADIMNMKSGTVISTDGIGITINDGGTIESGTVIGDTYGVLNNNQLVIGVLDGEISTTSPEIRGGSYGVEIPEGKETAFYDGILEGELDGYRGIITSTPNGAVVIDGTKEIDGVTYETDTLRVYENWLILEDTGTSLDGTEYNTIDDACSKIVDHGTIKVKKSVSDITFKQTFVDDSKSKEITFDLNGKTIRTTQPIHNEAIVTIIDSSEDHTGTFNQKHGFALVNDRFGELTLNGGNYITNLDFSIDNMGLLTIDNATFTVTNSAIYNKDRLVINDINITSSDIGVLNHANFKDGRTEVIYSYGTITMNGGEINSTTAGIKSDTEYADDVIINGGTINGTEYGIYLHTGTLYINDGNINATNQYAVYNNASGTIINGGTIKSKNNDSVHIKHDLEVNDGTIIGKKFGINGAQYCNAWVGCSYPTITINGGYVLSQTSDGIYSDGSKILIYNGTIEGELSGVNTGGKTAIGKNDYSVSVTSPVLIGHTRYGIEMSNYTEFYDGILKGIINGYGRRADDSTDTEGLINLIPTGAVIEEDFEYIEHNSTNREYQVRYLGTKGDWLQVGENENNTYNSLNAAYAAIEGNEGKIYVVKSVYVDFSQIMSGDKKVTLDLNGHQVILTKTIGLNCNTTIIDSKGDGSLHNIKESVISNSGTLTIQDGTLYSDSQNTIINEGTITVSGGKILYPTDTDGSISGALNNSGTANINDGAFISSTHKYGIVNTGTVNINGGEINAPENVAIYNDNSLTVNDGEINGLTGIHNSSGRTTVNGGNIIASTGLGVQNYATLIVNNGLIKSTNSIGVVLAKGSATINNGEIISLTDNGIRSTGDRYNDPPLTVNGGTITGGNHGIYNDHSSNTITIKGGTITGLSNTGLYTGCTTYITGGTLIGNTYGVYTSNNTTIGNDEGTVNIDNPVLRGEIYGLYINSGTLNFYDGIIEGYEVERINDYEKITRIPVGTEVKLDTIDNEGKIYKSAYIYNEQIIAVNLRTGDQYLNLQTAISSATDGDTIQIYESVNSVPLYYDVTIDKDITLDLNGKTITTTRKIINNSKTTITNSKNNSDGVISTSAAVNLISNNNELTLDNIKINNSNSSYSVVVGSGKLTLNKVDIQAKEGISVSGELTIDTSTIVATNRAITSTGKLTINKGTYTGGSYSIYSNTNSSVTIDDVILNGTYYNAGNNTTTFTNSRMYGNLQNYSNTTCNNIIFTNGIRNEGRIIVSGSTLTGSITNYGTGTFNSTPISNGRIYNYSGSLTLNDSTYNTSIEGYDNRNPDYAITNAGVLTLNNENITITAGRFSVGINNTGTVNFNDGSILSISGGTKNYALYNTGSGKILINDATITAKSATTSYGLYSKGENAKTTLLIGRIEATNAPTTYGAYLEYGTLEMGHFEGTEVPDADVSKTEPVVYSSGTYGIGVKKTNGAFNFYDGIVWGSKYSKPETTTNVESKFEATTYIDEDTGFEKTFLEWMPEDYATNAVAYINKTAFNTIADAIARADAGDVIKVVKSTIEDIDVPANKTIVINLNNKTVTGQVVNNGSLNIYNGTVNNFGDTTVINNGTFIMGQDDDELSGANIRIVSEKVAIENNGVFNMYDGYIEGNGAINGPIDEIPELSRIRTTQTDQSERKTLQSLSRESIINRETDLIITIDPNGGLYDNDPKEQYVYLKYQDSYNLSEHSIFKTGCDFDGWVVSDPNAYVGGQITANLSDIIVTAKWKVSADAVAHINNDYYLSLTDAIYHAKKNDTVVLLKDTEEDITNDKDITLDLNTHKVTGAFINNGNLVLINGTIENTDKLDENTNVEHPEEVGIGIINNKSLTMGINDNEVLTDSVKVIGTSIGVQNNGRLQLFDGYMEADIGLSGKVDRTPSGYNLYTQRITYSADNIKQRVYLIGDPENAIAETREGGLQYFFNLDDAVKTSAITGYEIYIRVDNFETNYTVEVPEGKDIVINLDGHSGGFANTFTNNGNLKIYDSHENKGSLSTNRTIVNNGELTIDGINVTETSAYDLIENNGKLKTNNAVMTTGNSYTIVNNGNLVLDKNSEFISTKYALKNNVEDLELGEVTLYGIETTKNMTLNKTTVVGSNYGILVSASADVDLIGASISSTNSSGIFNSASNVNVTLDADTTVNAANGLHCYGNAKYTVNGSSITGTTNGIYMQGSNCNMVLNDASITGTTNGILSAGASSYITVTDGEIVSTSGSAISDTYSRNVTDYYTRIKLNGVDVTGATNAVNIDYVYFESTNTNITTTANSSGNYGIYGGKYLYIDVKENTIITADNASGIYSNSSYALNVTDATINALRFDSYGLNVNNATINGNTKINTPGSGAVGIYNNTTSTITVNNGTIESGNIGISGYNVNVYDGRVFGDSYGIYQSNSAGVITIGSSSSNSTEKPYIGGNLYGVYNAGTLNFYSGRLRGYPLGYSKEPSKITLGKEIYTTDEEGSTETNITTYSTTNHSSEPLPDVPKEGNGYATITYIGETTDECINGTETSFSYKGSEDTFTADCAGTYKLEVWGAQGGKNSTSYIPGYGSYSTAEITLAKNETLYINVGGQGSVYSGGTGGAGGYNGGGNGGNGYNNYAGGTGGGGATHIATSSGLLSSLENNKNAVLIVAGGGGGLCSSTGYNGGSAGGYVGNNGQTYSAGYSVGGTQSSGYKFGQGSDGNSPNNYYSDGVYGQGGSGGGYYGGYTIHNNGIGTHAAGAGGSGYIGNTRLSNAYMYGYNVKGTNYKISYLVRKADFLQVGERTFNNFDEAFEKITGDTGTIYVIANANVQEPVTFPAGKTITFDLQGNKIESQVSFVNKGNLIITDSESLDKKGYINSTTTAITNQGTLTIDGASIKSSGTVISANSGTGTVTLDGGANIEGITGIDITSAQKVIVQDGNIKATTNGILMQNNSANVHIIDGEVRANSYAIKKTTGDGVLTIDGGYIYGGTNAYTAGSQYTGATITINGGTVDSGYQTIYIYGGSLTINGGTIKSSIAETYYYAITVCSNAVFTMNDGTILVPNGRAIYNTDSKIIINGGSITSKDYAIYDYGASSNPNITINGGTITSDSATLYLDPSRRTSYVKITKGNITSNNSNAIVLNNSSVYVTIGTKDESYVEDDIVIKGKNYGVYNTSGTVYYYDGTLKGMYNGYYNTPNTLETGKEIHTTYELNEVSNITTFPTAKQSSTATSNTPKAGAGYALITYLGETNETCENGEEYPFPQQNSEYTFNVPCTGRYKLEVWGGQGGNGVYGSNTYTGGYGAYATGKIELTESDTLYVNVGGAGTTQGGTYAEGPYNGGGSAGGNSSYNVGTGGGATHIATSSGLLSELENQKENVIIVAAGGGGGYGAYRDCYIGGSGGGIKGGKSDGSNVPEPATQSEPGANYGYTWTAKETPGFGQGGGGYGNVAGGGSGWYGSGYSNKGANGGSSYTGYAGLTETAMFGYNVEGNSYVINTLTEREGFLEVDGDLYNSFDRAVAAAINSTGKITLINDNISIETGTVPTGANIIFDLDGNTYRIAQPIINKGTLTITDGKRDGGTIVNAGTSNLISNQGILYTDDITLSASGINAINGNTATGEMHIKDTTINANVGIRTESKQTIEIETSNITGSQYGIYLTTNNNSDLTIKSGTIHGGNIGIYNYNTNKVTINGGTITGGSNAINLNGSSSGSLIINDGDFSSTSSNTISANGWSEVTLNGGNITNNDYAALYRGYGSLTMNDGYIYSKNSHAIQYYCSSGCSMKINGGTIKTDGYSSSGVYFDYEAANFTMNGGEIITTGSSSYGINNNNKGYSKTITINGGTINSSGIGVYLKGVSSSSQTTFNMNGGNVYARTYGIYLSTQYTNVNMGNIDNVVSKKQPYVEGGMYAIYKAAGNTYFYTGLLKGYIAPYNSDFNAIRTDYEIYGEKAEITEEEEKERTISTTSTSEEPIENTAKIGNGYAKVTYIGNTELRKPTKAVTEDTCLDKVNQSYVYEYTGKYATFAAECKGKYKIELWGAQGGNGANGGYTSGEINLNRNDKFFVYVGSVGGTNQSVTNVGGWNGGGTGGNNNGSYSYGGGGATDIRVTKTSSLTTWNETNSLTSRVMVAGGGGGTFSNESYTKVPGVGGNLTGGNAAGSYNDVNPGGGTQTGAGAANSNSKKGNFGYAPQNNPSGWGGGGGGGYWAGSTGNGKAGAGGSSYISGYTGAVAVSALGSTTPRKGTNDATCANGTTDPLCSVHYSGIVFENPVMNSGAEEMPTHDGTDVMIGNSGNGYAKITLIELDDSEKKLTVNFNTAYGKVNNKTKQYNRGDTLGTLETPTNYDSNLTFDGWYLDTDYTTPVTSSFVVNKNINVYAKFILNTPQCSLPLNTEYTFGYAGEEDTFTATCTGIYKLEVWGASGATSNGTGGYGGYSTGNIILSQNETLYINVGGQGTISTGGYNGGGNGGPVYRSGYTPSGGGGGATHIATTSGLLSTLENNKSSVLIVAGGGGGGAGHGSGKNYNGGSGGGFEGGTAQRYNDYEGPKGGTQTTGYAFGQGQNGGNATSYSGESGRGGAGGGWYGGYASQIGDYGIAGGGGGSGYIGNSRLMSKYMSGYNVKDKYSGLTSIYAYLIPTENFIINETQSNKPYSSLQTAITEANSGDKLTITDSKYIGYSISIASGKSVTLDLNGNDLTFGSTITNNGTLSIVDGLHLNSLLKENVSSTLITNNGTLNIDGIRINSYNAINNTSNATATIENTTISSSNTALSNSGTLSLDQVTISCANGITNSGTLTVESTTITSTATAISNTGSVDISKSTISGTNYSLYENTTSNDPVDDSAFTGTFYKNGTGTLTVTNNRSISGAINVYKGTLNITGGTLDSTIYNNATTVINGITMNSDMASSGSGEERIFENKNSLTINNSSITFVTRKSSRNIDTTYFVYNTGTFTSINNSYNVSIGGNITRNLILFNNTSLLTSTNDDLEVGRSENGYAIVNDVTTANITTISDADITISNSTTPIGIYNPSGTINVLGGTINITGNNTSKGIQLSGGTLNYSAMTTSVDSATAYGIYSNGGIVNVNTGTINATGTTAYGIYKTSGTITYGVFDDVHSESNLVSQVDPHTSATGTTSGIGIAVGTSTYNYYDGYIEGNTSARVTGEMANNTEVDYIIEYGQNTDTGYYYSRPKYNK